jgi:chaperonin GroEL
VLGEALKSVTDDRNTVLTIESVPEDARERIEAVEKKISEEQNGFIKKKLEQRLAMLSGSVGVIKVGANSQVELKEKKDRVEDAIYATKAALQDGIVPGGGITLLDASNRLSWNNAGEKVLMSAIKAPFKTILQNAGIEMTSIDGNAGKGVDVTTGNIVNMIKAGIIDPALVTKTALKNAVSVASTIISADAIISNRRLNAGD